MPGVKSNSTRSVAVLAVEAYRLIAEKPGHFNQQALAEAMQESKTRVHRIVTDLEEAGLVWVHQTKLITMQPEPEPVSHAGGGNPPGACSSC